MYVKFYAGRNGRTYDHPGCIMEWVNTPMTRHIYKMITEEMRDQLEENQEADRVAALVYRGVIITMSLSLDRSGLLTLITYHPGIMNAVMSVMLIRRGGGHNA